MKYLIDLARNTLQSKKLARWWVINNSENVIEQNADYPNQLGPEIVRIIDSSDNRTLKPHNA